MNGHTHHPEMGQTRDDFVPACRSLRVEQHALWPTGYLLGEMAGGVCPLMQNADDLNGAIFDAIVEDVMFDGKSAQAGAKFVSGNTKVRIVAQRYEATA
jgi:hypothetical protein